MFVAVSSIKVLKLHQNISKDSNFLHLSNIFEIVKIIFTIVECQKNFRHLIDNCMLYAMIDWYVSSRIISSYCNERARCHV